MIFTFIFIDDGICHYVLQYQGQSFGSPKNIGTLSISLLYIHGNNGRKAIRFAPPPRNLQYCTVGRWRYYYILLWWWKKFQRVTFPALLLVWEESAAWPPRVLPSIEVWLGFWMAEGGSCSHNSPSCHCIKMSTPHHRRGRQRGSNTPY